MRMPNKERDEKIYELRVEYQMTLAAIGRRFNLTRERVRQIVERVELYYQQEKDGDV
jgi:DNA-directed RNA polymerase specialized sigma subunit